ncbi:MAG: 4-(cytidine 5'-diphospho)-2-C-methyl-D-erythritol kinase [Rhizobiaceae bacterium]|nr:MAG: 4-(cytidine 5'-diphospho)-2-C-methyl-D-erythritol kinase [Rhizobiaceae bacterium]CAG1015499.1 4-diphosphocytidyl-2-C-methyl-D-erythritol kinase [Rhizobiaceae bacterium]
MTEFRLAPAKINLALHVTGRRADGYHLLESLVAFTRFGDRLAVRPAPIDAFSVAGAYGQAIPADDGNLVLRARDLLRQAVGPAARPVAITLEKNLPVASGVGGGSSDAAATLRALCRVWDIDPRGEAVRGVAAALGADVPMCLAARPLAARGIGHDITALPFFPALPVVLVNPGVSVSTPAVFSRLAGSENPPLPLLPPFTDEKAAVDWLATTRNDLEAPARALAPEIDAARAALDVAGAGLSRMSGSGATCFGLFASIEHATAAAERIRGNRPGWFVAATHTMASGEFEDEQD